VLLASCYVNNDDIHQSIFFSFFALDILKEKEKIKKKIGVIFIYLSMFQFWRYPDHPKQFSW